jgi:hypothetical protein
VTALAEHPRLDAETRVAIIDDRDDNADAMDVTLSLFCRPVRVSIRPVLDEMLDAVAAEADCAVFDHRLGGAVGAAVDYTGAEAAARCSVPSILISTFLAEDTAAIRQYQANIPRVLTRLVKAPTPDELEAALVDAAEEKAGHVRPERRAFRTVVRVIGVEPAKLARARVVVTAWRPNHPITLPASMICEATGVRLASLTGRRFMADVNIYASDPLDLFFANFAESKEPPADWMPAGLTESELTEQ